MDAQAHPLMLNICLVELPGSSNKSERFSYKDEWAEL